MRMPVMSNLYTTARVGLLASALALVQISGTLPAVAQETTVASPAYLVYAATDLNLRKGPGEGDVIFATIPFGTELERREGGLVNDYIPVRFEGIDGWVFALGVVSTPQNLPALAPGGEATDDAFVAYETLPQRVTISPLMLRAEPSLESESLAGMPEGSLVFLTQEGYENGYITVDYGGLRGWAYADLLAEPSE